MASRRLESSPAHVIESRESPALEKPHNRKDGGLGDLGCDHGGGPILTFDGSSRQAHWDVQLLEVGVAFHSIMM
jgi:hypothetical protein